MPHAKVSTFMYANDGSAVVATKITGVMEGGKMKDDALISPTTKVFRSRTAHIPKMLAISH
jgi:hypothetical protein